MSILQRGAHSMRIIALPLTRAKISQGAKLNLHADFKANPMLVFYHFDLVSPCGGREDLSWHKKALKSVTNRVADLWTGLGKAPMGSWKLWTYELGERMADRIDFEELALRSVDPSLGPVVRETSKQVEESQLLHSLPKIPLIYPSSLYPVKVEKDHALHPALAHLQTLLASRGPRHRRAFYLWMLITPCTTPIALIPLIPNLPLFFCVWRSWSHYRAYRSSRYLSSLLDRGLIEPNPSPELDRLYTLFTPPSRVSQNLSPPTLPSKSSENKSAIGDVITDKKSDAASGMEESLPDGILLARKAIPLVLGLFRLHESAAVDMHRALDQARGRLGESS